MTPDHLRALADQLDAEALTEARAGRIQQAVLKGMDAEKYRKTAAEMERVARGEPLPPVGGGGNVQQMTAVDAEGKGRNHVKAELARRGRGIAKTKASTALHTAAAEDRRFGSLRAYAKARDIGRSSLSDYALGVAPCPEWVDKLVRRDFPDLIFRWPKGVVK